MNHRFGIIFDVDGVIADSEAINVRATSKAFADILGIDAMRIEDFKSGIEAASAAGCQSIAVTNTCPRDALPSADKTVDTLFEVSLDTIRQMLRPNV